ncbi:MAG: bacteriocin [Clostridia bacterium]|nr:bacteriocin [Clostridia bacterium]
MAKTKEELKELKQEIETLTFKLRELSDDELKEVTGGLGNDIAPKDRDIAMVFQNYALYPRMTVYDNLPQSTIRAVDRKMRDAKIAE